VFGEPTVVMAGDVQRASRWQGNARRRPLQGSKITTIFKKAKGNSFEVVETSSCGAQ
jgi:hypothetical protein